MLVRFIGLGCGLLFTTILLVTRLPVADAQVTTVEFTPAPSPAPTPSPTPAPKPQLQTIRGGPLTFSLNGSLQVGGRAQSSTLSGTVASPSPSASPQALLAALSQNQTQTEQNAGLLAQVSRRTATTVTSLNFPLGLGSNGTQIGSVGAYYSTPKYSAIYGAEPVMLFGALPLGSTLRGFAFVVPTASGDETLFEGPALGAQSETIRLLGFRVRAVRGATYYEAGVVTGDGEFTGRSRTLTFGAATQSGDLSLVGEGAWQERSGGDGSPDGPAFQIRFDDGNGDDNFEATLRHLPNAFVAYGAGEVFGDNYFDTNWHAGGAAQQFAVDANWEHLGTAPGELSFSRLDSLMYNGTLRFGGYGVTLQQLATTGGGQTQLTNTATLQSSLDLGAFNALLSAQVSRSIQDPAGVLSTASLSAGLQRQIGQYGTTITLLSQRTTQAPGSPSVQVALGGGVSRLFGKTGLQLTDTIVHTVSSTSDAVQKTPLLTVSRQISPAVTGQVSYGIQTLTDRLNPSVDGRSRIVTFQLNAPFSFGSGVVSGRVDPHLPATIVGRVQSETTGNGALAGFASSGPSGGGLSNVIVVLDDKYVQRTDLTGGFQFSFVPPGQHQLRIDTSSVPRGLTVDRPVATVTLQGGQVSQVLFQVGNFGGILGHVFGTGSDGQPVPLPNVQVRLDGGAYSQTDTTGAFGFGGLQPGQHTVEVIENTVPAFATFDASALKQSVTVRDGGYTKVTFRAVPLGSISGKVVYGPEMLPEKGGVPNAYVVAEPGEHAAIDEDDGSYVIDDLPPGTYTVSVDPETLTENLGAKPQSIEVTLKPGGRTDGVDFRVGRFEKKVVFSFVGGSGAAASSVTLREQRLPPRATTQVAIDAPANAQGVAVAAFGKREALEYDETRKEWIGEIAVPASAKAGTYAVDGEVSGAAAPSPATLTVDPKIPLAILQCTPANAVKGQYVMVRARFLVDVRAGDTIRWVDGQVTTLGKPVSGRVFTFSLLISLRPMNGELLTRHGSLPIQLL